MISVYLCAAAWALDPGDRVEVQLTGGGEISGSVKSAGPNSLVLTGDNQEYSVSLTLVESAQVNGSPSSALELREETAELYHRQTLELARLERYSPRPLVVFGTSMLWPGAGHMLLGERGLGIGYAVLELVLVSTGAFFVYTENYQSLVPLVGVETLFRVYAVADATGKAKRRRARLQASPMQGGVQVALTVPLGPMGEGVSAAP